MGDFLQNSWLALLLTAAAGLTVPARQAPAAGACLVSSGMIAKKRGGFYL